MSSGDLVAFAEALYTGRRELNLANSWADLDALGRVAAPLIVSSSPVQWRPFREAYEAQRAVLPAAAFARQDFAEHFHTFRVWAQTLTDPQLRRSDLSACVLESSSLSLRTSAIL